MGRNLHLWSLRCSVLRVKLLGIKNWKGENSFKVVLQSLDLLLAPMGWEWSNSRFSGWMLDPGVEERWKWRKIQAGSGWDPSEGEVIHGRGKIPVQEFLSLWKLLLFPIPVRYSMRSSGKREISR